MATEWRGHVNVDCPDPGSRNRIIRKAFPRVELILRGIT